MKTQHIPTPTFNLSYDLFEGSTPIPIPPALAQQYRLSLFRIRNGEYIDVSNKQYYVRGKEYTPTSVRVNVTAVANLAASPSTSGGEPSTSKSDPTEKYHQNDPTKVESAKDYELYRSSESEHSYLHVGDIERGLGGRTRYILRVTHRLFTATEFNVQYVFSDPI